MAILFDLDGTLLDTSHDIHDAVNALLISEHKTPVSYEAVRPFISFGGRKILAQALNLDVLNSQSDKAYLDKIIPKFLEFYRQTNFKRTFAFPGINQLLTDLETMPITWGIVTNKIQSLTEPLLKTTGYYDRSACVVCGDTTNNPKPHPAPLHHACNLLQIAPNQCLYVGDSETDIQAGKAAGMATMAVSFGYIPDGVSVADWQADYIANTATEILPWVRKWATRNV